MSARSSGTLYYRKLQRIFFFFETLFLFLPRILPISMRAWDLNQHSLCACLAFFPGFRCCYFQTDAVFAVARRGGCLVGVYHRREYHCPPLIVKALSRPVSTALFYLREKKRERVIEYTADSNTLSFAKYLLFLLFLTLFLFLLLTHSWASGARRRR